MSHSQPHAYSSNAPLIPKRPKLMAKRVRREVKPLPWICFPPSDPHEPFVSEKHEPNEWLKLFFGELLSTATADVQSWLWPPFSPSSPSLTTSTRSMISPTSSRRLVNRLRSP